MNYVNCSGAVLTSSTFPVETERCKSSDTEKPVFIERQGWTAPPGGRLAAWHLPGELVDLPARCAATSNVEVGQTTFPVNRGRVGMEGRPKDKLTKRKTGKEGVERGGARERLAKERGLSLNICAGHPRVPSYDTADGAGLPN